MSWGDAPVEIAFIDVCKAPELSAHVSREFYTALIPGASTLVHQDFFFDMVPWIRVSMGYLAEYFSWEGQVASSSLFRNVAAVPEERVAAHDPFVDGTLEECLAHRDAMAFPGIDRATQLRLALSLVQLLMRKGSPSVALEKLREVAVQYVDIVGETSTDEPSRPRRELPRGSAALSVGSDDREGAEQEQREVRDEVVAQRRHEYLGVGSQHGEPAREGCGEQCHDRGQDDHVHAAIGEEHQQGQRQHDSGKPDHGRVPGQG